MKTKILFKQAAIFFLCCFVTTMLLAQTRPAKQWDARFGGSGWDGMEALHQTSDGGYILGGWSKSPKDGDQTQPRRGAHDYWIVKTDAAGLKQWDKRYGGDKLDVLLDLKQTIDNGYIMCGYSHSGISGDKTEGVKGGGVDYWVVKTDAAGVKQWDVTLGGNKSDVPTSVQQTTDGGYIVGGVSSSGISGDKTEASRGSDDYWIVKINSSGIKQWDRTFGGSSADDLTWLQQTTDGGYILGGFSNSGLSGDKTQVSKGNNDYWIVKTDANGIKQWDADFGGSFEDDLNYLQQTTDGGYILGGLSYSGISGNKTQSNRDTSFLTPDFWIVKTNAGGIKQWDKTFGGTSYDWFVSLQQTADGGYILGGWSDSPISGDKTQSSRGSSSTDYWTVKTGETGIKQWDARFGGNDFDDFLALDETSDGGFILGGTSYSGISGDKTQDSRGDADFWIVKLECSPPNAAITPLDSLNICTTGSVVLKANAGTGFTYQWQKNNNNITGATNRKYTATEAGTYKVIVTNSGGCSNTSNGVIVTNSCAAIALSNQISTGKLNPAFSLYPNPSRGNVTVTYNSINAAEIRLMVYDVSGKAVFNKTDQATKGTNIYRLNLSHLITGNYYLQLNNGSRQEKIKFVLQK